MADGIVAGVGTPAVVAIVGERGVHTVTSVLCASCSPSLALVWSGSIPSRQVTLSTTVFWQLANNISADFNICGTCETVAQLEPRARDRMTQFFTSQFTFMPFALHQRQSRSA